VIPALNEAENIAAVVRELPWDLIRECIVVDNGSTDATAAEAAAAGARVVHQPQPGYGRACAAGAAAADKGSGILVFMDGDGSDVSAEMGQLLDPILAGECDFVIGSRMRGKREPGSMLISQALSRDHPRSSCPVTYAGGNLRLEPGDADALRAERLAHPGNPSQLPQSCRRSQQSGRITQRFRARSHTHHSNPATRGLQPLRKRTAVPHPRICFSSTLPTIVRMSSCRKFWRKLPNPSARGRSPATALYPAQPLAFSAAVSIAFHSSGERCNFAAAMFSSRCFTEDVPGMGSITGE
jgi:Glycosyl transferase family 2